MQQFNKISALMELHLRTPLNIALRMSPSVARLANARRAFFTSMVRWVSVPRRADWKTHIKVKRLILGLGAIKRANLCVLPLKKRGMEKNMGQRTKMPAASFTLSPGSHAIYRHKEYCRNSYHDSYHGYSLDTLRPNQLSHTRRVLQRCCPRAGASWAIQRQFAGAGHINRQKSPQP